jgi:WhiB family redox-sensing transcriptional regulator
MSIQEIPLDVIWQNRAACRGPNQAIFFPPPQMERRSDKRLRERRAKEICSECAVQADCRRYAIEIREQHGIWGGLTEVERRSAGGW